MIEALRALVSQDSILEGAALDEWRVAGVRPLAVVMPEGTDQTAAILGLASAERVPVEPAGAGTWLRAGSPPPRPPVVLSTRRLQRITEYEPADLVATVQAGVTLFDLVKVTRAHGQFLALDPPASKFATIGATVATASAGPLRYAFGTPRDQVLGLEIVTGDGRVLNLGGKVVKNVAGYDLTRLLVGSRGTLGVITRVHVRLRPWPARDATFILRGTADRLIPASAVIHQAALEAAAIEVVTTGIEITGDVRVSPQSLLLVRIQGNEAAVAAAGEELAHVAGEPIELLPPEQAQAAWRVMAENSTRAEVSVRLAALPSAALQVWSVAQRVRALLPQGQVALHAGAGIVRVDGSAPRDASALVRAIGDARAELERLRGSVLVAVAPPGVADKLRVRLSEGAEARLMRELKKAFDPAGILAPERYANTGHDERSAISA